jgi:tetratricopeptide (TPR) repeat protein/HPt (histidine-containing phosphotransfer) domain-containing protein
MMRVIRILALTLMPLQTLQATAPPDLIQLWEQIYNEPGETLLTVKALLRAQPANHEDERTANLYAIGAEAASYAEKIDEHKQLAEAAEKLASQHRWMWAWVHAVSTLAIYYEYDGQDARAIELHERALHLAEEAKDPELLAFACNNLGYYFARSGKAKEGIEVIRRAMHALKDQPKGVLYYDVLNNLALVYTGNEFVGRTDQGRRMLEESMAYFKRREMRYMIGNNYINLALFHNRRGEHQTAIDTFVEAIAFTRRIHKDELLPYYLIQLADTYNSAQRYEEALVPTREACQLFRATKNTVMSANCLLTQAFTLVKLKRPEEALTALHEREGFMEKNAAYEESEMELEVETDAWHQLGHMKKELDAARRWLRAAKRIYNRNNSKTLQQIAGVLELERKEAENKLLEEKDRTNTLRLEQAERMSRILIGLLTLSLLFVGVMLYSLRQSRVIRSQRDRMQEVLDNIEEGILRFGKDFQIRRDYSAHVPLILDASRDLTGQDLFPALFTDSTLSADEQATIRAALANIFDEDEVSWSFNSHQLPSELHRRHRILNLLWQPHYDSQRKIDKMLLVIRDVTSHKKLEAEVHASRLASETMTRFTQQLLQANARSLEHFMADLESQLMTLPQALEDPSARMAALRQLHTIKGNARTLGLMELAEAVHQVEATQKNDDPLEEVGARFVTVSEQYAKLFHMMFKREHRRSSSLLAMVDDLQPGLWEQIGKSQAGFGSITVQDEVGHWPSTWEKPLRVLLLHALSNAVDHGYVLPHHDEAVRLQVEASPSPAGVRLCIRDRGCGIHWDRLQKLAEQRNFTAQPGRPLTDLLFADGVSTSEAVSLSSGRGVGLAAVQDACRELGGKVTLLDNDEGQGTMLIVEIPKMKQALSA